MQRNRSRCNEIIPRQPREIHDVSAFSTWITSRGPQHAPGTGRRGTAGRAVVVSEENCGKWQERSRELDFGGHVGWFCRPFTAKPRAAEWQALIDQILEVHACRGLSLVLIDPLSLLLPARSENDATCVQEAVLPLQRLASAGLSVWANHHPRKGRSAAGQAARGSGALAGFADILVEMRWYRRATDDDRRRKLVGFSR
jgi:hypothetical protein